MEKNIKDPVKTENPTGFSVIVREFKKDKIALFSFFAVTIFIIAVFVASMFINLQQLQTVDIFRNMKLLLSITFGISLEEILEDVV